MKKIKIIQYDTPINANDASFEQVALQVPLPIITVIEFLQANWASLTVWARHPGPLSAAPQSSHAHRQAGRGIGEGRAGHRGGVQQRLNAV